MKKIIDQKDCTGCNACYCICPKNSIRMVRDREGFSYPQINEKECVNCGLCIKACPILNYRFIEDTYIPEALLICAKDKATRVSGASGGLFLTVAKDFIMGNPNSIVVGAAYDDHFSVNHIIIDSSENVNLLAKSKYVQSDLKKIYVDIKEKLTEGTKVLFSGTPCQVYGLKSYLKKTYENLYCIDVVCHGVPSPLVFEKYLSWQREKHGYIEEIISRDKRVFYGGYAAGMRIRFSNGIQYFETNENDYYGKCFWGEIASRPSCYTCKYKTLNHISDLTLGDCWFSKEFTGINDTHGFTLAFIQSVNGKKILDNVRELVNMYKIDSESAVKANGGLLYRSAIQHPRREEFFKDIASCDGNFAQIVEKYFPPNKPTILKRSIRKLPYIYLLWKKYSRHKDFKSRMKRKIPDSARGKVVIDYSDYR